MSAALQLVRDDGLPPELARLRSDLRLRTEALQRAYEDAAVKDEMLRTYQQKVASLKGQITRQERETRNVNHELVVAVIDFWRALRRNPRLARGPKRAGAILARLKDDPPAEPKDFVWPVLGLVLAPVPKKAGGWHDDIEVALRDEVQLYKWRRIGEAECAGNARERIEELGGRGALEALDRLLELQRRWEVKGKSKGAKAA